MSDGAVPLREFFERILSETDRRLQQRFESQETRLQETRDTMDKRLDGLNENRSTVADLVGRCITRDDAINLIKLGCTVTGVIVTVVVFALQFFLHK